MEGSAHVPRHGVFVVVRRATGLPAGRTAAPQTPPAPAQAARCRRRFPTEGPADSGRSTSRPPQLRQPQSRVCRPRCGATAAAVRHQPDAGAWPSCTAPVTSASTCRGGRGASSRSPCSSSSATVTPSVPASGSSSEMSGRLKPRSHLLTALSLTPTSSASCRWVKPFSLRSRATKAQTARYQFPVPSPKPPCCLPQVYPAGLFLATDWR